jgi:hypothetical protein
MPALRRNAPMVRFITFDTLTIGVLAFECALSVRKSSFVHGLMTGRATFLTAFLTTFWDALAIH